MDLSYLNQSADVLENMNNIYTKDSCLSGCITFIREDQLTNQTRVVRDINGMSAVDFGLGYCYNASELYLEMRKNLPPYY